MSFFDDDVLRGVVADGNHSVEEVEVVLVVDFLDELK